MMRFPCPSCQKTLSAPEEKAGTRTTCPFCKNPVTVAVPAKAPTAVKPSPPSPPQIADPRVGGAPRPSVGKRLLRELAVISFATFRQTLKPFTLVFEIHRRNRLRRKAGDAQFALGQRLYETRQGDKKVRARIQALGERIHGIQDVRGDARQQVAERKALILQLADPALAAKSAPDAEGELERARLARASFEAQEKSLGGALGGLLPPDRATWCRTVAGYALAVLVGLGAWQVYGLATGGARQAHERESLDLAAKQAAEQTRQEEDALWAKEKNTEQIVEKCGPSVALIRFKVGKQEGGGTGFMIRPGVLVTNAHVVDSVMPDELKVYFPSAKDLAKTSFTPRVLFFDRKRDLAFLAVDPKVPPLRLADNFEFKSGKNITVIGCPGVGAMQLENAVNTGVLSTKTEVEKMPYYQLGISVNPGNSGGPVFDNHGQVIGVVTLKASQESIAFCVPWQDLKDRLEGLEKDDPHRIAAPAQSMHRLHVVVGRVFVSSIVYTKKMAGYAFIMRKAAAKGVRPDDMIKEARAQIDANLRPFAAFLLDDKHKEIGAKLLADTQLSEELRRKFGDLWKTCDELKKNVDDFSGGLAAYESRAKQLETRFKNNMDALKEALGLDIPNVDDGGGFGP
jgi:S1-C subfamily serine protease